ncbi:MAG: sugar phosphate isomerase/epimerase family protein [Alphaproteobacteria bacterium]
MTEFSYQLYSSRNFPPLANTMKMVAALGYTQVEGYGALYKDADAIGQLHGLLDEHGLTMPSGHFALDQLEDDVDGVLAIARDLGIKGIFCPYLPENERPTDGDGYQAFGQRLQAAGAPYRAAGISFGWHNHDFEFKALADGSLPMERIFQGGPDLSWEADVAWIARSGADVDAWIKAEADRLIAVHIKDIAPAGTMEDEDGWADIGEGTLDWAALMASLRDTAARLFIMEHDNPSDDERFARRSITAAKTY